MFRKLALLLVLIIIIVPIIFNSNSSKENSDTPRKEESYWLLLHRKSNKEFLFKGVPGEVDDSQLLKTFQVKSGRPGMSPTPLPELLGREYWLLVKKESSAENPETAPYFLTLDIPATEEWPYGPVPYEECNGQCDWVLPGFFGLHGVNGDEKRLSGENPGSSGCVRHKDKDITYLYNILTPEKEEVRYYIKDL